MDANKYGTLHVPLLQPLCQENVIISNCRSSACVGDEQELTALHTHLERTIRNEEFIQILWNNPMKTTFATCHMCKQ
ncbi:hypothetical protein KIN20_030828 [Parelaphostrongylus tenuis]|uniref:Uncharacterized protein n=1 Tax=Parelaphostrongylus tenuis TaxID=148309 RepID=A0AAD5R4Q5_PARTN|nr:hypothetical protein KIN20_030828 [Parelaphostrongylus tenuis]